MELLLWFGYSLLSMYAFCIYHFAECRIDVNNSWPRYFEYLFYGTNTYKQLQFGIYVASMYLFCLQLNLNYVMIMYIYVKVPILLYILFVYYKTPEESPFTIWLQ